MFTDISKAFISIQTITNIFIINKFKWIIIQDIDEYIRDMITDILPSA